MIMISETQYFCDEYFWNWSFRVFIGAWKYIFKTIIFIHAAFSHKLEVFSKFSFNKISNIPLILYF